MNIKAYKQLVYESESNESIIVSQSWNYKGVLFITTLSLLMITGQLVPWSLI